MIILPVVKLGTMPFGPAKVKSARKFPKIGDNILIKNAYSKKDKHSNPWIRVKVDQIKENEIYFVSYNSHGV